MRGFSGSAFILCLVSVFIMAAASVYAWTRLPGSEPLPVHWGADGIPDRFARPPFALSVQPGLTLLISILFALIPAIEPRRAHLAQSSFAYRLIWVALILALMLIHFGYISAVIFEKGELTMIRSTVLGVLFMVIGFVLPGIKSNFFVGVRTPWTLSSESVWAKTHRLAGPVFFLFGLSVFVSAFAAPERLQHGIFLYGALTAAAVVVLYSLIIWLREKGGRSGTESD